MPDIVDLLWQQIEPIAFITKDQFARGLEAWDIEPVEIDGRLAFAKLTKGPEFHLAVFGESTRISPKMGRAWLQPIIDQHGFVTTKTPKDDHRQHRFNKLIGFSVDGEDEFFIHYRMEELQPGRSVQCQS